MRRIISIILVVAMAILLVVSATGCGNRQLFDTTYSFDTAIISLPNGEIVEGKVSSWMDYEDDDQIQVVVNGKTYLVHSSNIVLIND